MKVLNRTGNAKVNQKGLADHLLRAGLITPNQLQIAIAAQKSTGMHLYEIVVAQGWVKENILEDLVNRLMGISFKSARYLNYRPTFQSFAA